MPKDVPERKSIRTGFTCSCGPGTLEPKLRVMPSLGWIFMASTLGLTTEAAGPWNRGSGGCLNCRAISVARRDSLLPAVSYTHLRAHETKANLVCRLLLDKKKKKK